jgi:hypothetical protein
VLKEDDSYLLEAVIPFEDNNKKYGVGDTWLLKGPSQ